ncbi:hypothetical protein FRC11_005078 [Ceratobasidium sp. 423]|nr:hypothetical protein FRC11_005078 [Ceratobasidium sp. 423]
MFGAFRPSSVNLSGLLWKTPWRLSPTRKTNQRERLKRVDAVIEAVRASGVECAALFDLRNRRRPLRCLKSMKCLRETNILPLSSLRKAIGRGYIKFQNLQGYAS